MTSPEQSNNQALIAARDKAAAVAAEMEATKQSNSRVVVWKYPFEVEGYFERDLPAAARIISVAVQLGQPCFWALVHPHAPEVRRRFYLLGTGHEIHDDDADELRHLGSFMLDGGRFVGHLFEIGSGDDDFTR